MPLRWIRIGVEERAERHPSIQPERDPAAPRRTSGTGQNRGSKLSPHPTTHVHVPRDATRASASQGRFQNLTALWFTRAAAGRHMSQAASGRRGFVLPGRERDGGIGGFCFSARTLHRRCTVLYHGPRSTNLACTARSWSYSQPLRALPTKMARCDDATNRGASTARHQTPRQLTHDVH